MTRSTLQALLFWASLLLPGTSVERSLLVDPAAWALSDDTSCNQGPFVVASQEDIVLAWSWVELRSEEDDTSDDDLSLATRFDVRGLAPSMFGLLGRLDLDAGYVPPAFRNRILRC